MNKLNKNVEDRLSYSLLGICILFIIILLCFFNTYLQPQWFEVKNVIDGDTILLSNGESIRYLGIDAPETHHPSISEEVYGIEATEYNRKVLSGEKVKLERGDAGEDRDNHGRLLRFVYTESGKFVNYEMVLGGYAQVSYIPPETKYWDILLEAQSSAKDNKKGIWADISKLFYKKEVS